MQFICIYKHKLQINDIIWVYNITNLLLLHKTIILKNILIHITYK